MGHVPAKHFFSEAMPVMVGFGSDIQGSGYKLKDDHLGEVLLLLLFMDFERR